MNTENDNASVGPPLPLVALVLLPEEALHTAGPPMSWPHGSVVSVASSPSRPLV